MTLIEMPQIAVVIPCYNHAYLLRRTLKGLTNQTLKSFEVVVIDDGSSDNPEIIIRDFADVLQLRFIRFDANQGAPAARNRGARETNAPFLIFLDADAELIPEALEKFVRALDDHPEAGFAYSNFWWGMKRFRGRPFDREELKKRNYIHTSSLLRRVAFPGFDENLIKFQDWDLWLTMAARGSKGAWIDDELYRIEPRKRGMSRWLPKIAYWIPWQRLGFVPKDVMSYREAEEIVRRKHGI